MKMQGIKVLSWSHDTVWQVKHSGDVITYFRGPQPTVRGAAEVNHGVRQPQSPYGKCWCMHFEWSSYTEELKVKTQLLQSHRRYNFEMRLALNLLKPCLTHNMIDRIVAFAPPYAIHVKQMAENVKTKLASPMPW